MITMFLMGGLRAAIAPFDLVFGVVVVVVVVVVYFDRKFAF
jgi:hypothetical protein